MFYRHFQSIILFRAGVSEPEVLQALFSSFIPFLDVCPSAQGAEVAATKACAGAAHPLCRGISHIGDSWRETGSTGGLI